MSNVFRFLFFIISSLIFGCLWTQVYAYSYSSCSSTYGFASYELGGSCACASGYSFWQDVLGRKQCISTDQLCKNEFGYWAQAGSNGKCSCSYKYRWNESMTQCEYTMCGLNSSFQEKSKSCECYSGYIKNESWECAKPDIPAVLIDIRELDNNIILYTQQYGIDNYHQVTYGFGCVSIRNYLDKVILIKTDNKYVDILDTISLPWIGQSCTILQSKLVTQYTTLRTCQETFGDNSVVSMQDEQSCICKPSYQWNTKRDACVPKTKSRVLCWRGYLYKNGICKKISQ